LVPKIRSFMGAAPGYHIKPRLGDIFLIHFFRTAINQTRPQMRALLWCAAATASWIPPEWICPSPPSITNGGFLPTSDQYQGGNTVFFWCDDLYVPKEDNRCAMCIHDPATHISSWQPTLTVTPSCVSTSSGIESKADPKRCKCNYATGKYTCAASGNQLYRCTYPSGKATGHFLANDSFTSYQQGCESFGAGTSLGCTIQSSSSSLFTQYCIDAIAMVPRLFLPTTGR
jgi:hypothetical protein